MEMTKFDENYFQEKFPNLYKEIENEDKKIEIDGVRTEQDEAEKATKTKKDAVPNVVDYLRLCDTEDEAVEIINYMEEEGRIKPEYAKELRGQVTHDGLRSFGPKRDTGEYSFNEQDQEQE